MAGPSGSSSLNGSGRSAPATPVAAPDARTDREVVEPVLRAVGYPEVNVTVLVSTMQTTRALAPIATVLRRGEVGARVPSSHCIWRYFLRRNGVAMTSIAQLELAFASDETVSLQCAVDFIERVCACIKRADLDLVKSFTAFTTRFRYMVVGDSLEDIQTRIAANLHAVYVKIDGENAVVILQNYGWTVTTRSGLDASGMVLATYRSEGQMETAKVRIMEGACFAPTCSAAVCAPFNPRHGLRRPLNEYVMNLFDGYPARYVAGITAAHEVVRTILWHIEVILCDRDTETFRYIVRWLAAVTQGYKVKTAITLFSLNQQVGKGLFGQVLKGIFGRSFRTMPFDKAFGRFNAAIGGLTMLVLSEMPGLQYLNGDERVGKFKEAVTEDELTVEEKFRTLFSARAPNGVWIETNNPEGSIVGRGNDARTVWIVVTETLNRLSTEDRRRHIGKMTSYPTDPDAINAFFSYLTDMPLGRFGLGQERPRRSIEALTHLSSMHGSRTDKFVERVLNGKLRGDPNLYLQCVAAAGSDETRHPRHWFGEHYCVEVFTMSQAQRIIEADTGAQPSLEQLLTASRAYLAACVMYILRDPPGQEQRLAIRGAYTGPTQEYMGSV